VSPGDKVTIVRKQGSSEELLHGELMHVNRQAHLDGSATVFYSIRVQEDIERGRQDDQRYLEEQAEFFQEWKAQQ
jgi:hypothetical protein